MPRVSLRLLWPYLTLPAVLLVVFLVALIGGSSDSGVCSGHDGQRVTTLGGRCALLVPGR
jgi:hypothetical protein